MANKNKKRISKTEKSLRGKINYRESKKKKLFKELDSYQKEFTKGDKVKLSNKLQKRFGLKNKDTITVKQFNNYKFKEAYTANNEIDVLRLKLEKRFKIKSKYSERNIKRGDDVIQLGLVWEVDKNLNSELIENRRVSKVGKLNKKEDLDLIIDKINIEKLGMNSTHIMFLIGRNGNYDVVVQNKDSELAYGEE